MSCTNRDLTLDEALSDPVIGAALRADRVDPRHFETLLRTTARRLDDGRRDGLLAPLGLVARSRAVLSRCANGGDLSAW